MKAQSLMAVLALFVAVNSQAAGKTLVCTISSASMYGINNSIELRRDMDIMTGESKNDDGDVVIQFSLSECEDSTLITLSPADAKALKAGKKVSANIEQEEPDFLLKALGSCQIE